MHARDQYLVDFLGALLRCTRAFVERTARYGCIVLNCSACRHFHALILSNADLRRH